MVDVFPLPAEVRAAMRRAQWRNQAVMAGFYVVAGGLAVVFVLATGTASARDLAPAIAIMAAVVVLAGVARASWVHGPVLRAMPLAAPQAAEALVATLRGRAKVREVAGGVLVEGNPLVMPAWFAARGERTWMATTSGTARIVDRALAARA